MVKRRIKSKMEKKKEEEEKEVKEEEKEEEKEMRFEVYTARTINQGICVVLQYKTDRQTDKLQLEGEL